MYAIKHAVVVVPTYNEKDNIIPLLTAILHTKKKMKQIHLSVLVVDDSSPDGTADLVKQFQKRHRTVHIISGERIGLGNAYVRGFQYALCELHADIVVQMDADFSHDPDDIPRLIEKVHVRHAYIIGSRYVKGGSIPTEWPFSRVLISKVGNAVARYLAGLYPIKDCTGGFKAIDAHLLKKIDLTRIGARGYSFQMNLLHAARQLEANIIEVPIHFIDRTMGVSKMRIFDMLEFFFNAIRLRLEPTTPYVHALVRHTRQFALGAFISLIVAIAYLVSTDLFSMKAVGLSAFFLLSALITVQSFFTLLGMMYAWEKPERVEKNQSPKVFLPPEISFTALIPALHEEKVISDTIRAAAAIDYPNHLKEIIIICRADDGGTIAAAQKTIDELHDIHIRLIIPPYRPKNKPDKLNYGLEHANNDVVCVFDAEDAPHHDIYNVVNTVMLRDQADVVQSGVQLINFRSNWFSTLNVLEYFFWFKSVLHFFAEREVIPLGGNTVFFRKDWLTKVHGWDADCLTEDADIGIKLSSSGAKIRIIYDEMHATQEETPPTIASFIKQRTRWNQGFLQVFKKGDWKRLPRFSQRLLVGYILIWPEIQAFFFLYILASVVMIFTVKLPMILTLFSMLPFYILVLHLIIMNVGLYEFTKKYHMAYPTWMPLKVVVTFIPFQLILGISAVRAVLRNIGNHTTWEKTEHINAHRLAPRSSSSFSVPL